MENITFLFRSKKRNAHSIENVFRNIEKYYGSEYKIYKVYLPREKYFNIKYFIENIKEVKKIKTDIIHITGEIYFCALFTPKSKTVMTIHDYVSLNNLKGILKFLDWLLMYYLPIRRCKYITCISKTVYDETIRRFPWSKNKLFLVYNSVSDEICHMEKSFNETNPILLFIGTLPHKNLLRVAEALQNIVCRLDIVGKLTNEQITYLENNNIDYQNYYNISNNEIIELYKKCDIVCFPSTYEGFGMPIIEGQAIGRVVITSCIEPMVTVANKGACIVNPYSVDSIKNGILRIINDSSYREELITNGLKNAENYRAEKIAKKYLSIYKIVEENI